MQNSNLRDFYAVHENNMSDKWEIYLPEYDRIFLALRNEPIRLLEIGIQNGGSLEIWAKYFPNAQSIIGADINPKCANITPADSRIQVVIWDANAEDTQARIQSICPRYEIILDDGSHLSSDIIKSFAKYFPILSDGGLYIAEDLHCSYWEDYEGGLAHPYSSIAFFKQLADIVNHEHWGIERSRTELLDDFRHHYKIDFDEEQLSHIRSIEFVNSMCIVRKAHPAANKIGKRIIAGKIEQVVQGLKSRSGTNIHQSDETNNPWSTASTTRASRLDAVNALHVTVSQLTEARNALLSMQRSSSWRMTAPYRWLRDRLKGK